MKFVIVGGGTAGWLTALYIKKYFPNDNVTVVASSKIGILGAGEGTTPAFLNFLKDVNIQEKDIFENCGATVKTGIKFTNWNGDGDSYDHPFFDGRYALHFNARLLAQYLQKVSTDREITYIDDEVVGTQTDDNKNIVGFNLQSGLNVQSDFVFDCTGFKRKFIGEFYKSPWNSYKDVMPAKRAIPFFLPNNENKQYTESIALRYGWMWKIPVQGRYGCGYVFNPDMVSDEEAKQEIRDLLGHDFQSPTTFNFEAGAYDKVYINNCMAVGLSAGFIEPLEATSIWVQLVALKLFVQNFGSPNAKEKINNDLKDINDDVVCFLYFHYLTKRKDTEFWSNFENNNNMPSKLKDVISKNYDDSLFQNKNGLFEKRNWEAIKHGIRYD